LIYINNGSGISFPPRVPKDYKQVRKALIAIKQKTTGVRIGTDLVWLQRMSIPESTTVNTIKSARRMSLASVAKHPRYAAYGAGETGFSSQSSLETDRT
jgi:hypothetical protein